MIRLFAWAALLVALIVPSLASADAPVVLARLPRERQAEVLSALRLELAGRATLVPGAMLEGEPTIETMRAEARDAGATHAVWVVFPGGLLAPAEVRVLDVARTSAAHAMTPQAWDVVDARVVAVIAASLMEASAVEPPVAVSEPAPEPEPEAEPVPEPVPVPETDPAAAPERAPELAPGTEAALTARPPRTFRLWFGTGISHQRDVSNGGVRIDGPIGQIGFYGRVSEWASIGVRFRGGAGYSSIEGAIVSLTLGVPSIAVSFRESLGTAAALELGVHAEGGLTLFWRENAPFSDANALQFGIGVGAYAILELGAASGLQLDYTLEVFGLGSVDTQILGSATLSYVHRWD